MLALLLAATLSHPVAWPGPTQPLQPLVGIVGDEKAPKALDAWLKLYRSGKIDFRSKDNIAKDSIAMKFGVAPKSGLGHPTWAGDLEAILEALVRLDTAEAALGVLEVAAIGIDQGKYTVEMAPYDVRALAETWAAKFTSAPAKETFAKAARGELKVDKAQQVAMQTAGIHCLVKTKDLAFRQVLEQALGDGDEIVRISAAEGLGALGDDTAALALIALLERDTVDAVLIAAAQSLRSLYSKHLPKSGGTMAPTPAPTPAPAPAGEDTKPGEAPKEGAPKADDKPAEPAAPAPAAAAPVPAELPESVRLAVRAALKALGRTTWRADMALVRLLDDFRSLGDRAGADHRARTLQGASRRGQVGQAVGAAALPGPRTARRDDRRGLSRRPAGEVARAVGRREGQDRRCTRSASRPPATPSSTAASAASPCRARAWSSCSTCRAAWTWPMDEVGPTARRCAPSASTSPSAS
jgi:hypothetical protein